MIQVLVEKLVVRWHRQGKLELFSLCDKHSPEEVRRAKRVIPSRRWAVWRRDGFCCVYCGIYGDTLTLDHIVPVSAGGSNRIENLATACRKCNQRKGHLSQKEFKNTRWLKRKKAKALKQRHTLTTTIAEPMIQPTGPLERYRSTGTS